MRLEYARGHEEEGAIAVFMRHGQRLDEGPWLDAAALKRHWPQAKTHPHDSPIAPWGVADIHASVTLLRETHPQLEHIVCSPALRCVQTACYAARGLGIQRVTITPLLREDAGHDYRTLRKMGRGWDRLIPAPLRDEAETCAGSLGIALSWEEGSLFRRGTVDDIDRRSGEVLRYLRSRMSRSTKGVLVVTHGEMLNALGPLGASPPDSPLKALMLEPAGFFAMPLHATPGEIRADELASIWDGRWLLQPQVRDEAAFQARCTAAPGPGRARPTLARPRGVTAAEGAASAAPLAPPGRGRGIVIPGEPMTLPAPPIAGAWAKRPAPLPEPEAKVPFDPSCLATLSPEQQKNLLGEYLFAQIAPLGSLDTAKVTGMLLELEGSELVHVLNSPSLLQHKVQEAEGVLRQHYMEASHAAQAQGSDANLASPPLPPPLPPGASAPVAEVPATGGVTAGGVPTSSARLPRSEWLHRRRCPLCPRPRHRWQAVHPRLPQSLTRRILHSLHPYRFRRVR